MAVDIKIELFSIDLFRNLWFKSGLRSSVMERIRDYNNLKSENSLETVHAVWCRQQIFRHSLFNKVWDDYSLFSSSGIDFYLYIQNHALLFISYQLNIFDKLLMSCAFVLEMASCCFFNGNSNYVHYGPLSWAMFFDFHLKSEFYFEGGWEILKKYASSYSANILTGKWMKSICKKSEDDYTNVKLLFESAKRFYCFSKLFKVFAKRFRKRKEESNATLACFKCLPMFLVLKNIVFPGEQEVDGSILIEGYLQIFLRMLSEKEIAVRRAEFFGSLENENSTDSEESNLPNSDDHQSTNSDDHQSTNSSTEEENELQTEDPSEIVEEAFRVLTTAELSERLFVDEASFKGRCSCGMDPCIFCGRIIDSVTFSEREKLSVHVDRIKTAIAKVKDTETKNATASQISHRKTSDMKEVFKMFLPLGLEPMKSHVLSSLKGDNIHIEQKDQTKKDVDDACEVLSSFTLHDSPNKGARNKTKRKKSVKK